MAPELLRQNLSFQGPFDNDFPVAKERETIWDWWERNGDAAQDILQTGLCAAWPNRPDCRPTQQPGPFGETNPNNLLVWIAIIIMVLVLLFLIFKK